MQSYHILDIELINGNNVIDSIDVHLVSYGCMLQLRNGLLM